MNEYALPFLSLHKMATDPITAFDTRLHKQYPHLSSLSTTLLTEQRGCPEQFPNGRSLLSLRTSHHEMFALPLLRCLLLPLLVTRCGVAC